MMKSEVKMTTVQVNDVVKNKSGSVAMVVNVDEDQVALRVLHVVHGDLLSMTGVGNVTHESHNSFARHWVVENPTITLSVEAFNELQELIFPGNWQNESRAQIHLEHVTFTKAAADQRESNG